MFDSAKTDAYFGDEGWGIQPSILDVEGAVSTQNSSREQALGFVGIYGLSEEGPVIDGGYTDHILYPPNVISGYN
jgi:hypothetical protein